MIPGHDIDDLANSTYKFVTGHHPGMHFGADIFTTLNFICFKIMCVWYTGTFVTTKQTAKQAGRAIKMGALVVSDLLCWAPIIILSLHPCAEW